MGKPDTYESRPSIVSFVADGRLSTSLRVGHRDGDTSDGFVAAIHTNTNTWIARGGAGWRQSGANGAPVCAELALDKLGKLEHVRLLVGPPRLVAIGAEQLARRVLVHVQLGEV
jgi:hypothetical protein